MESGLVRKGGCAKNADEHPGEFGWNMVAKSHPLGKVYGPYLFEMSPVPVFEVEQVVEDGERRLAQLRVRDESHLEERTDYSWNGEERLCGKMETWV